MKPIVARRQIVLSVLVWIGFVVWSLERDRRAFPQSRIDSVDIAMAVIFGMGYALVAFLSLRPRLILETEAEKRGRILGGTIAIVIAILGIGGILAMGWYYGGPGRIR